MIWILYNNESVNNNWIYEQNNSSAHASRVKPSKTPCKRKQQFKIQQFELQRRDGNEIVLNVTIGLISNSTTLRVHHAFLYISLPSFYDYDVKLPNYNLTFCRRREQKQRPSFAFFDFDTVL